MTVPAVIIVAFSMVIVAPANHSIKMPAVMSFAIHFLAVMDAPAFIAGVCSVSHPAKYLNVSNKMIVNVVNVCHVAQLVSSVPMHVMVPASVLCLAVMIANVESFVRSFLVAMVVYVNMHLDACPVVMTQCATFVNV